jgi:hypothetical protein
MLRNWRLLSLALGVAVLWLAAAGVMTAGAQSPFTAYGTGLTPGDVVEAFIGGESCGTATADAEGNWILRIDATAACGPSEGDVIEFSRNSIPAGDTATWTAGGTPATSGYDADVGITLMTATSGPSGDGAPQPADTGHAGVAEADAEGAATVTFVLMLLAGALVILARAMSGHIDSLGERPR